MEIVFVVPLAAIIIIFLFKLSYRNIEPENQNTLFFKICRFINDGGIDFTGIMSWGILIFAAYGVTQYIPEERERAKIESYMYLFPVFSTRFEINEEGKSTGTIEGGGNYFRLTSFMRNNGKAPIGGGVRSFVTFLVRNGEDGMEYSPLSGRIDVKPAYNVIIAPGEERKIVTTIWLTEKYKNMRNEFDALCVYIIDGAVPAEPGDYGWHVPDFTTSRYRASFKRMLAASIKNGDHLDTCNLAQKEAVLDFAKMLVSEGSEERHVVKSLFPFHKSESIDEIK